MGNADTEKAGSTLQPLKSQFGVQFGKALKAAARELRKFAYGGPKPPEQNNQLLRRPRVGLALGGGFARGIAHVGVLKVFVENQIPIDALAGTSSGSIAAAAFASGCSVEELILAARSLRWNRFARWTIPRLGFATNERMDFLLANILHCRTFEQLKIPLAVVAADIWSGEAVIFREGDLLTPVRASCSFPGLFVPIEYMGHLLVDGVLVGSVPVMALRGVDVIVAVQVQGNGIRRRPTSFFEVVGESFHIAQSLNESSWRNHCDLAIEPKLDDFRWDDFQRTDELIAAGEMAARTALPALCRLLRERATHPAPKREPHRRPLTLPPGKGSPVPS